MSLFGKIFSGLSTVAGTVGGAIFGGPAGAAIGSQLGGAVGNIFNSNKAPSPPGIIAPPPVAIQPGFTSTFPTLSATSLGRIGGAVAGGVGGALAARAIIGKFSKQPIPRGTREKITKNGQIVLTERRRSRGLSGRDLRGFNRTIHLLRKVGMVPRRLSHARVSHKRRAA